jgi:hypothetical protein
MVLPYPLSHSQIHTHSHTHTHIHTGNTECLCDAGAAEHASHTHSLTHSHIHPLLLTHSLTHIHTLTYTPSLSLLQVIQNACATQALLSVLLNRPEINVGATLTDLRDFTREFSPEVCVRVSVCVY